MCDARGVALGAAALQFAMRHPAVTTVLVGARSAAEVDLDVEFAATAIDDDDVCGRSRRPSNGQTGAGVCEARIRQSANSNAPTTSPASNNLPKVRVVSSTQTKAMTKIPA